MKKRERERFRVKLQRDVTSLFNSDFSVSINVAQLLLEPFQTASRALSK